VSKHNSTTQCAILFPLMTLSHLTGVLTRAKKFFFRTVRRLPYIGKQIDAELDKQKQDMEEKFHETVKGQTYLQKLPAKGMSEVNRLFSFQYFAFLLHSGRGAEYCNQLVCLSFCL